MEIGRVIGTVVATRKDNRLVGTKLLVTVPIDTKGKPCGVSVVAVDMVGAGTGDRVIYTHGSVASHAYSDRNAPIDAVIVGIVDAIVEEAEDR
jgi:ethanolamine utilization protein EutN